MRATILNIQRMSTEDGPGIRTTVFFKGCPLSCAWCHNPESIDRTPRVIWQEQKCIGCRTCDTVCENGGLRPSQAGPRIDPASCRLCGACTDACPAGALMRLGAEWEVEALAAEVAKDRVFFEESGGGVTASGGEPALWPDFLKAFFKRCREQGLHTALDTCGACPEKLLLELAEGADLVLLDLKDADPDRHRRFTGQSNARVLENARALAGALGPAQTLWIRTPLIPGATATRENLSAIGRFIASDLGGAVERWELLAFNNLCREQYRRLGRSWEFKDTPLLTRAELDRLADAARASGFPPDRIAATGPTRVE
jgi:pyruvate formate lyase activating enzyme